MRIVGYLAAAFVMLLIIVFLTSCSPKSMATVNKQAPDPPYAGQYHGGLDRAQYLRDEEPLEP